MNNCNLGRNLFIFCPQIRYLGLNLVHQTKKKKKKRNFFALKKRRNLIQGFVSFSVSNVVYSN